MSSSSSPSSSLCAKSCTQPADMAGESRVLVTRFVAIEELTGVSFLTSFSIDLSRLGSRLASLSFTCKY